MSITICYCFGVTKEAIEEDIANGETLDNMRAMTGLGYGCGGCIRIAEKLWGENGDPNDPSIWFNAVKPDEPS